MMTMLEDQQALQIVLENLSAMGGAVIGASAPNMRAKNPLQACTGMFYNVTEKNSAYKEAALEKFDMKKPSPASVPNVTEHVYVPSSEHVAEIVGRQGCKIKALRNKTNTYIKTPGRGEEPLFIITGQRCDVALAVNEIKQASAHFTNIRAQRNKGLSPPALEGQVTDRVQVPYRVVGLVVGPKGQTIKQIQTKTQTYIVTPSRERDPIFEITGLPENVAKAREEIISYITVRTGMFLEENAIGELTFNGTSTNAVGLMGKTPTGVWNPSKQDIDEFDSVSDALCSSLAIYGDTATNARAVFSQASNERQFGKPLISVAGSQSSKVRGKDQVNDENRDPISEFNVNADSAVANLLRSPMRGLNVNTYNPFIWDNSGLVQKPKSDNELNASVETRGFERETLGQFRFGTDYNSEFGLRSAGSFGMTADPAKVSPLSDGSQHSSSDSCASVPVGSTALSVPTTSVSETVGQFGVFLPGFFGGESTIGTAGASLSTEHFGADSWLLTPPAPRVASRVSQETAAASTGASRDKCRLCSMEAIDAALVPCGHLHFCYHCARDYMGAPCPSCSETVKNVLRIFKE